MKAAGLELRNETENNLADFSEEREGEDWSERVFLGVSIGIMAVVGLVTLAAILLVFRSNWKLKNYSNIYSNSTNNDIDSSLQSSLKRYSDFSEPRIRVYRLNNISLFVRGEGSLSVPGSSLSSGGKYDNYVRIQQLQIEQLQLQQLHHCPTRHYTVKYVQ